MRIDSVFEANGHTCTVSTSSYGDDQFSDARCTCGWSHGGFLTVAAAEEAQREHVEANESTFDRRRRLYGDTPAERIAALKDEAEPYGPRKIIEALDEAHPLRYA